MNNYNTINFKYNNDLNLQLTIDEGCFIPNITTKLLIDAYCSKINQPQKVLDLGCGTGVVGITLQKLGLIKNTIYASDLSASACRMSEINFTKYGCTYDVRYGSLFEPWNNTKFDIIIDDLSAISNDIAMQSSWFNNIPCDTGESGIELILKVLKQAPNYLNKGGMLFFPVLSLSNHQFIVDFAKQKYDNIELIAKLDWPIPDSFRSQRPLMQDLYRKGMISFKNKFGILTSTTSIYYCKI